MPRAWGKAAERELGAAVRVARGIKRAGWGLPLASGPPVAVDVLLLGRRLRAGGPHTEW